MKSFLFKLKYTLHQTRVLKSGGGLEWHKRWLMSSVRCLRSVMILWFHVSAVVFVVGGAGWSSVFLSFNHPPRNHFMLPPADLLNEDADFLFQLNLAPAYIIKLLPNVFTVLQWPANVPGLNPKQTLWDAVMKKTRSARAKKRPSEGRYQGTCNTWAAGSTPRCSDAIIQVLVVQMNIIFQILWLILGNILILCQVKLWIYLAFTVKEKKTICKLCEATLAVETRQTFTL